MFVCPMFTSLSVCAQLSSTFVHALSISVYVCTKHAACLSVLCPHLGTCIQSMQVCLSILCPHLYMCVQKHGKLMCLCCIHICIVVRAEVGHPGVNVNHFPVLSLHMRQADRWAHKANKRKKSTLKPVCLPTCVCLWFRLAAFSK